MSFKWTAKQEQAWPFIKDDAVSDVFLYGGGRSAKTFLLVSAVIARALKDPESRHVIVRSVFTDVKNSIAYQTFPDVMDKVFGGVRWHLNKQDFTISFGKKGRPQIWLCGVENNERVEKVLGLGLNTIFINEISQIGYKTFCTLATRLANKGKKYGNKILLDANPPAQFHWSYKRYILGEEPTDGTPLDTKSFRVLKMNPYDNPNISSEYIPRLSTLPLHIQERYLHGEFAKGVESGVYSNELEACEKENRRGEYPYQTMYPCHAVFDIGVGDATAVWVVQFIDDKIFLLEYFEHKREALPFYINWLMTKRSYKLMTVVLPHDAKNKNWGTGRTIVEAANDLGRQYRFGVHVVADHKIADGIHSTRMLFKRMHFDRRKTQDGFEALQNYEFGYNEQKGTEGTAPIHNWASHGSDALRYVSMFYSRWTIKEFKRPESAGRAESYPINGFGTFRDLLKEKGILM